MLKILLLTTSLVVLSPVAAKADPITVAVAGFLGGGAFATAVATALVQFGISMVVGMVAQSLAGKPNASQQDVRRDLQQPSSLPAYRFVYGNTWAPGTPVAWTVRGKALYICYLLNSRPSALNFHTVLFDKRATTISGDPFNFAGPGATVTNDPWNKGMWENLITGFKPYAAYWIGRGDQTSCPAEIVAETGGEFQASDAWTGRTVLWARLYAGPPERQQDIWPASPPELNVHGDWSLVHDPRTGTETASSNQALIVLDALRNNPIKPYADPYLWLDTFKWAADVADQAVPTKSGSPIPRYRADGILVWATGSELEDQINPLLAAGASRLSRIGGRLAIIPAVSRSAVYTVTEFSRGQDVEMRRWQPTDRTYTECVATYVAPDRSYEEAEAPVYIVGGAQEADGGLLRRLDLPLGFVTDARQAQRLAKIAVMRSRMQREISAELWPDAFDLVAGSVVDVALSGPWGFTNGRYEVASIHPAVALNEGDSITLRLPATLREDHPSIYAWDPATEEGDIASAPPIPAIVGMQPPASITLTTGAGAALTSADTVTPRVQLEWPATVSSSATGYEWQYRIGSGEWISGGVVSGEGERIAWISPAQVGASYTLRVRAYGPWGSSDWRESATITATGPTDALQTPEILLAVGGVEEISLTARQADDGAATQLEIWASETALLSTADLLTTLGAGANVTVSYDHTGLGTGETLFYWARARNGFGAVSPFSARATATTI